MKLLKQLLIVALVAINVPVCYASKQKFVVDSIDAATNKPVRVVSQKIGKHDYQKYGSLSIGQYGDKYYITFPIFYYTSFQDNIIPRGSKIVLKLQNNEVIRLKTDRDIKAFSYYRDEYPTDIDYSTRGGWSQSGEFDVDGVKWLVSFELTQSQIKDISQNRIIGASFNKGNDKLIIPIKHRQSKKMERSVQALVQK